jgi:hypothetical protein
LESKGKEKWTHNQKLYFLNKIPRLNLDKNYGEAKKYSEIGKLNLVHNKEK